MGVSRVDSYYFCGPIMLKSNMSKKMASKNTRLRTLGPLSWCPWTGPPVDPETRMHTAQRSWEHFRFRLYRDHEMERDARLSNPQGFYSGYTIGYLGTLIQIKLQN